MRKTTEHFEKLVEIFHCDSKKSLEKHCQKITVYDVDLVGLILAGQHGDLSPYHYANHFERTFPKDGFPNEQDHSAIASNGLGLLKTRESQRFSNKIFHLFKAQRSLAAHLFYTLDYRYWYLIYFDNRDVAMHGNHWKGGPHVHMVSDAFGMPLEQVWTKTLAGETNFAKLHVKYAKAP